MSYLYNTNNQPVTGDISTATTIPTGTGATARSLRSHFTDVIWAADYGVQANGSSDDTAAWVNAFLAATGLQKYTVIAPAGVSIISTIQIPIGVTLRGAARNNSYPFTSVPTTLLGSVLKKTSGTDSVVRAKAGPTGGNDNRASGMVDMAVIGDSGAHHGVTLDLGIPFYFTNCTFVGCNAAIEGNTTLFNGYATIIVDGCEFAQNTIGIWNVSDSRISNSFFNSGNGNGIQLDSGAQDNSIVNCKIEFNTGNGIQVDSCEDMIISNCLFDSNSTSGLRFTNCRSSTISGNAFRNQSDFIAMSGSHIFLQGNTDVCVFGNSTRFSGAGATPTNSVNLGSGNTSVIMFGNAWKGHSGSTSIGGTTTGLNGSIFANVTGGSPLTAAMVNSI